MLSSKYATIAVNRENTTPPRPQQPSARISSTPIRTPASDRTLVPQATPSPRSITASPKKLASEEEFLKTLKSRGAGTKLRVGHDLEESKPRLKDIPEEPSYLVLTHDPAPSTSFWVPNFPQTRSVTGSPDVFTASPSAAVQAQAKAAETKAPKQHEHIDAETNAFGAEAKLLKQNVYVDATTATGREATPWRPTASFKDLPTRVLERVFNYLPLKSQQRSFMLASKRGYRFLSKHLYSEVRISLNGYPANLPIIQAMAAPDGTTGDSLNPGIKYIRRLIFYANEDSQINEGADMLARSLVNVMEDVPLEWFSWPSNIPIDPEILYNFWKPLPPRSGETQLSNLQSTEHIWSGENLSSTQDALARLLQKSGKNMRHLDIIPISGECLERTSVLLSKMLKWSGPLETFSLDLRNYSPRMGPGFKKWDGSIEEPVSSKLFGSLYNAPLHAWRTQPYTLIAKLVLKEVNLYFVRETFLKAISLRTLKHLELFRCPFAGRLLAAATTAASAQLGVLRIDHDVEDAGNVSISDAEDPDEVSIALLRCLSCFAFCLRTLHVRLRSHAQLAVEGLQLHCPDLQSLHFDCAYSAPRSRAEQTQKTRDNVIKSAALTTYIFGHDTVNHYHDLAIATAGDAWSNGRQVKEAFLGDGIFQRTILKCAAPSTLTFFMSRGIMSLLYDNPTQRLRGATEQTHNRVLEPMFAKEIAATTFAIESELGAGAWIADWVAAGSTHIHRSALEVVIIAVDGEEEPSKRHESAAPDSPESWGSTLQQNGGASAESSDGGVGHHQSPIASRADSMVRGTSLASSKPKRYCFVRGFETNDDRWCGDGEGCRNTGSRKSVGRDGRGCSQVL